MYSSQNASLFVHRFNNVPNNNVVVIMAHVLVLEDLDNSDQVLEDFVFLDLLSSFIRLPRGESTKSSLHLGIDKLKPVNVAGVDPTKTVVALLASIQESPSKGD